MQTNRTRRQFNLVKMTDSHINLRVIHPIYLRTCDTFLAPAAWHQGYHAASHSQFSTLGIRVIHPRVINLRVIHPIYLRTCDTFHAPAAWHQEYHAASQLSILDSRLQGYPVYTIHPRQCPSKRPKYLVYMQA